LVQRAMEIAQAVERAEEAKAAAAKRCAEVDVDRADGSASGGSSGGDGRGEKEVDAVGVSGTGGAPPARNILPFSDDLMLLVPGTLLAVAGSGKDEEVGVMFGRDELPPTVSCALYVVVLPTRTYVGETADLSRRIEEHRTSGMLPRRSSSRLFYVSVENKSVGRQLETTLQMRLSDMGVAQVSMVDAAHKSF
jgi:predicted GIY-YIG superfamily endonuclease